MTTDIHSVFAGLIQLLKGSSLDATGAVKSWSPVPYFGDLLSAEVATVGLNPSDKEFENRAGTELSGDSRRLHTLTSLGLSSWSQATGDHVSAVKESCDSYFHANPYWRWFGRLEPILTELEVSYRSGACHLDLVPFATRPVWGRLKREQRSALMESRKDIGHLIAESPIRVLILNGAGVVKGFARMADIELDRVRKTEWDLVRKRGRDVRGWSFKGVLTSWPDAGALERDIVVLGFNHNIPGTPGTTGELARAIGRWARSQY